MASGFWSQSGASLSFPFRGGIGGDPIARTAPTFQAAGADGAGIGNVTPGLPSGWAENDIFNLFAVVRRGDTAAAPALYTEGPSSPVQVGTVASGNGSQLHWFWKRATASESAPTIVDPGEQVFAKIIGIRGCVTSGDPFDGVAGGGQSAVTAVSMPDLTTTFLNALILQASGRNVDNLGAAFSGWANANLSSVTERSDFGTASGTGSGLATVTGVKATNGAIGNTTATVSNSAYLANLTIAFKGLPI